jgi:hypothetical protein
MLNETDANKAFTYDFVKNNRKKVHWHESLLLIIVPGITAAEANALSKMAISAIIDFLSYFFWKKADNQIVICLMRR